MNYKNLHILITNFTSFTKIMRNSGPRRNPFGTYTQKNFNNKAYKVTCLHFASVKNLENESLSFLNIAEDFYDTIRYFQVYTTDQIVSFLWLTLKKIYLCFWHYWYVTFYPHDRELLLLFLEISNYSPLL